MKTLLFSFQGRIARASFWKGVGLLALANILVGGVTTAVTEAAQVPGPDGSPHMGAGATILIVALGLLMTIVNIWTGLSLSVKRCHDRDKSGWWVLIQLVPIVGALWLFVETGCLAGTQGRNRFGADPLTRLSPEVAYA